MNDLERAWVAAAESGDVEAMHRLGVRCWQRGRAGAAQAWWRRAGEAGHVGAMNCLAVLLARTDRTLAKIFQALEAETWWRRAAQAGDLPAMHRLGKALWLRSRLDEAQE